MQRMKTSRHIILALLMLLTFGLYSCQPDTPKDNPKQFPINDLVDTSVNPGDDFFRYCNGTWIKNHSLAPDQLSDMFWMDAKYSEAAFRQVLLSTNDPVVSKLLNDAAHHDTSDSALAALRQKTCQQLETINQLTSLDEVMAQVATMGMKGYHTGIQLFSQPVERRIQTVMVVLMPKAATPEAWMVTTGCSEQQALEMVDACQTVLDEWTPKVGIAVREKPYAGNEVVAARRLLADAIGVPVERMIYGETIDQDDFLNTYVDEGKIESWKWLLLNAIVDFNYRWTKASPQDVVEYLTDSQHPLAYRITKLYSETYRQQIMRDYVYQLVEELRRVFVEMVDDNTWLSETTKQAAKDKALKLDSYVGYPDTWQSERLGSVPNGNSLLEDMELLGEEWCRITHAARSDQPSRDDIWFSLTQATVAPYNVNAMNMTEMNGLYIYMPMLLPNMCRQDVPDAYNYGMVGAVAGHELGHGFDTAGYRFGSMGEWLNWWTDADATEFRRRTKRLADYMSQYSPLPGVYCNGDQTTVEDVADLNGVNMALNAMLKHYRAKGATEAELLRAKQEFFLAYGNLWCGLYSDEYIIHRIQTNIHSIGELRINGIVRHIDEWYEAYDIRPSDQLYLAPSERVRIWN